MFLSRNKKNNVYPCKPQFYYIKVGFKGIKIIYACICDVRNLKLITAGICFLLNVAEHEYFSANKCENTN